MMSTTRFVIVAGEASGDILGASLIIALKKRYPEAIFEGIGGPLMEAQGFHSMVPMERLSVMGLVEVLGRIRELLSIRKQIYELCTQNTITAFIGIDSPDFNLPLEKKLKAKQIKTIHYVSPSVWAWRKNRLKGIKQSVDLMLTLFPFEQKFYHEYAIPVVFVGHPLADQIPLRSDQQTARKLLDISPSKQPVFAMLPGSRGGEVSRLAPVFIETMKEIRKTVPTAYFVMPAANSVRKQQIMELLESSGETALITTGMSRDVMIAADAVLLASGTATLEAMLVKRPMVVAYRFATLTYAIMSRLVTVPYVALPNLLAERFVVPEFIQNDATPTKLAAALLSEWRRFGENNDLQTRFEQQHLLLRQDAGDIAADAIQKLLEASNMAHKEFS